MTEQRAVTEMPSEVDEGFERRTDRYRRELLAHCYRMLGSVHDAEDLVQETLLRAWRAYDQFDEGRASMRTWLYRIATNACLTALESRGRRPLPSGLGAPGGDPEAPLERRSEVPWLQPIPDALLAPEPDDPAAIAVSRDSVRLALIAALQHLPARQRAVLIMRDVLAWRAAEVADLLDLSTPAVNSALQRARAHLAEIAPAEDDVTEPSDAEQRELLDRYVTAFVNADVSGLMDMLRDDIVVEMPPALTWFTGSEARRFLAVRMTISRGAWRMVSTRANGRPAVGAYRRGADGVFRAHSVQLCAFTDSGIAHIIAFQDPGLFPAFGLPDVQPDAAPV